MSSLIIDDFVASKPPVIITRAYFREIKPGLIIQYEPTSGDFLVNYNLVYESDRPVIGKCDLYISSLHRVLTLAELWFDQTSSGEINIGLCKEADWETRFCFRYFWLHPDDDNERF